MSPGRRGRNLEVTTPASRPHGAPGPRATVGPDHGVDVGARWSHRFTWLAMFVYLGKVADIFPALAPLHIGKVLVALAVIAVLIEGGAGWRALNRDPIWRPFLGILALIVLTLPVGVWPGNSFNFVVQTFSKELMFIFLVVGTTRSPGDVRRLVWAFAFNAALLDFALYKYGVLDVEKISLGRNEIAMISAMAIGLLAPLHTRGFAKLIKLALIGLMVATILFSNSRGGYLGLAAVGVAYLYLRVGGKIAVSAFMVLLLGALIYIQLPSYVKGRVDSIINYEQDYNLTAQDGRIQIWQRGLTMIANDPLTGVGFRNFPIAEGLMHQNVQGQPWMNAHNSPLQVAAEIGVIGLIFYITLLVRMYRASKRLRFHAAVVEHRHLGTGLTLAFVGYVVCGFFLSQGFTPVFYILMALILAAARVTQHTEEAAPDNRNARPAYGALYNRNRHVVSR